MQLIAAPRQFHQLVAQIMVIVGRAVDGFRDALAAVIVGIRPRLSRRLIVLAHELVEAVVGIGRRALTVGDGRDVPARVVGIGIRRRAGLPSPDLPRGRRGRGVVVADRGLDHGLPAILLLIVSISHSARISGILSVSSTLPIWGIALRC